MLILRLEDRSHSWRLEKQSLVWWICNRSDSRIRIWHRHCESMDPTWFVSTVQDAAGGVMTWGLPTNHGLWCHTLQRHRVLLLAMCISLWPHYHLLTATSNMIMHNVTKQVSENGSLSWAWQRFTGLSWVTTSESSSRAWICSWQICRNHCDAILSVSEIFSTSLQNPRHEELRMLWGQAEAVPSFSVVYSSTCERMCALIFSPTLDATLRFHPGAV